MKRTACGGCSGKQLNVFLDLGATPLANRYRAEKTETELWYPLQVAVCNNCGLAQLMEVVPDHEIYGVDYGFYSGGSEAQRQYHKRGAELLLSRHRELAEKLTVEVACNDGSLLSHFAEAQCNTLGIDPAEGPVELARKKGLNVVQEALTTELAHQIRDENGPAGLIIAYNSMAHVENLADVLAAVRTLMDNDSVAVFEVQYLPDLLAGNMYDQVYHEHRYFYSLTSLKNVCELHGLFVVKAELIELQGGGLRVTLSADPYHPRIHPLELRSEDGLEAQYAGFQSQVNRTREHLRSLLVSEAWGGRSIAGYAAAAKATTIVNFCELRNQLKYVIDTTEYKQGRYLPGTNIPIVSPETAAGDPADTLLLLSANYIGHVLRSMPDRRWVVPQPLPTVI